MQIGGSGKLYVYFYIAACNKDLVIALACFSSLLINYDCQVVAAPGCVVADTNMMNVWTAVRAARVFAALHKITQEIALCLRVVVSDVWAALAVHERPKCSTSVYFRFCAEI